MKPLPAIACAVMLAGTLAASAPVDLVDPFIGTAGAGNVYPGVTLPFGFIQVSPDTGPGSGAGGYKHSKHINGFSQQHISGMGGPLYGMISVFPLTGALETPSDIVSSGKSAEAAVPGYYTVTLAPWQTKVELTATKHVALHRHTFPAHKQARIVVDAGHCLYGTGASWGSAKPIGGEINIDPRTREVSGHMTYQGARSSTRTWKVFFVVRFDTAFASHSTWADSPVLSPNSSRATGGEIGACLDFTTTAGQVIQSRVALSYKNIAQARGYLETETPGWDFDAAYAKARDTWADALAGITVEGGTPDQQRQFYTALYRAHLTPNDWTGEAPSRYGDAVYYENILCLWDTFRTINPLLALIRPDVQSGIVNTLIRFHQVDGWTGDAHSAHTYEHMQNGSSADVVIADAYVKKLPGIDWRAAYAAIRKNAFVDNEPAAEHRTNLARLRLDDYRRHHYLPADATKKYKAITSVSRTLEYVYNDFCVLTLARDYGDAADIADLESRLTWYKNLWDETSGGFMRGRNADGTWHEPFDPLKVETGRHYYEGRAWTWSWYVPHDPQGLIALHGSPDAFVEKLTTACERYYEAYNEPAMLQTYLFTHAGRPDLTQHYVRKALSHFSSRTNGLPGNDDSGTTSAWLVWALIGLYPNAGQDFYYIGSPSFTKTTIRLGDSGKILVIHAPAASPENKYIASARLNGRDLPRAWLRHSDIIDGGELFLEMVSEPTAWGSSIYIK